MNRAKLTMSSGLRDAFADAVSALVESERTIAALHAERAARVDSVRLAAMALYENMQCADRSSGGPKWSNAVVVERVVVTEIAAALRYSETDARRLVHTSESLNGDFFATRDALDAGEISYLHAEKIVKYSSIVPLDRRADYEARVLEVASRTTAQRTDRAARGAVEEAQPTTAVQRHLAAAAERRLQLEPAADGMAFLTHYLPAVEAVAIFTRATDVGRSLRKAGDPRTLTQLRADVLSDLMLNGETNIPGATHGLKARVHVTVPALTLLDSSGESLDEGPARLEGYGPIDRLTALKLTRDAASFVRVLTDPTTGCALTYGRLRYKPPPDLDDLVRLTYAECTFPIACTPSSSAELDHTEPWEEGNETRFGNLSPLCSSHHKVKHHTEWMIEQHDDATITWTSPAGFVYTVTPTPIARPAPRFASATPPEPSAPPEPSGPAPF